MGVLWPEIVLYYNEYQNQDICLCTLVCFKNMISGKNSQIHFPIRIIHLMNETFYDPIRRVLYLTKGGSNNFCNEGKLG